MKSVECKGRNVEEAVDKALKLLKANRDNVVIEVLEHPEDRMFGLFVKPAVVRVTLKTEQDEMEQHKQPSPRAKEIPLQPGTIQIVNGIVRHLATEDKKPTIIPSEHILVTINGQPIEQETEVNPHDKVEIKPMIYNKDEGMFDIHVDEKKLTAKLTVIQGFIERFDVRDTIPSAKIEMKEERVKEPYVSFTKEDILQELNNRNIIFGIDELAIEDALERKETCEVIVARGEPPVEGKNGYVEFLVKYEISDGKPKLLEDGTVDYREIRQIPMVEEGETIGIIHPPIEGQDGISIENKQIKTEKTNEAIIKGRGIEIQDNKIIATENGTIRVQERLPIYHIDVIKKMVHNGDVDLKSGNISFNGDIEITGNVEENMLVQSKERILIMQNVHGATVEAANEIVVNRNIIRSKLSVGKADEEDIKLKEKTNTLLNEIKSLEKSVLQLVLANRKAGLKKVNVASIVRVLVEQKYESFSADLKEYLKLLHQEKDNDFLNINELNSLLYKTFVSYDERMLEDEMIFLTIQEKLATLYRYYEQKLEPTAKLTIGQAQQSEVFCNGDIYLMGRGAYNSTFHAEGKFVTNGFIRGGSIYAGKGIEVNEVGSGFGVETILSVPATETIKINHAKEDTIIQIGKRKYRFVKERSFIEAKIDETGTLVLA